MALATPRIDALLSRLRGSLRRQVWLHGFGTVLAVSALWLLFAYLADRFLHLPGPVRIVHSTIALLLPAVLLWRHLAKPLGQVPGRSGLAVLAGRAAPETRDVLVSAVQLSAPDQTPAGSPDLIAQVVADGEEASGRVDLRRVLEPSGPKRRAWLGAGAVALCGTVLAIQPAMTGIFFARAFGAQVSWPRKTTLIVEIPSAGDGTQVETSEDEVLVRAARGSDVPVLIRAEGVVPAEVILSFDGGYESVLASGGSPLIRTSLRAVQEDLTFRVRGGDDDDGFPIVRLEVLQPPDVTGLAFDVTPPAYTGLPAVLVFGTSIEVLEGSSVRVHIEPDPHESTGTAHLLPADRRLPLESSPFPRDPSAGLPASDSLAGPGLAFDLEPTSSVRFHVELVDSSGLPNPDPGLFAIEVEADRKPELTMLSPSRTEVDVVAGGSVPLRVRVGDDFGLASMGWDIHPPDEPELLLSSGDLTLLPFTSEEPTSARLRDERIAVATLEVASLDPGSPPMEGRILVLQVVAYDRREPVAGEAQSAPIRLRVVSADEYMRRLKEKLARIGDRTEVLFEQSTGLVAALRDLEASYDSDDAESEGPLGSADQLSYSARRLAGDTRTVGRDLSSLAEGLLYSQLDPRSGALLQAVDSALATDAERTFRPATWLGVTDAYTAGSLGRADLGGDLVELVGLALGVSERNVEAVQATLQQAASAADAAGERTALLSALASAREAETNLETMLTRLGEWDDIQSVLSSALEALNRQKSVHQRTKSYAEDH